MLRRLAELALKLHADDQTQLGRGAGHGLLAEDYFRIDWSKPQEAARTLLRRAAASYGHAVAAQPESPWTTSGYLSVRALLLLPPWASGSCPLAARHRQGAAHPRADPLGPGRPAGAGLRGGLSWAF